MTPDDWQIRGLGELVTLGRGHDLPEQDRRPGRVPVMGSGGVNGFHAESRAPGPGVTVGRSGVGSMGFVAYSPVDYWPHNTVLYARNFNGNDPRFVYYALKTIEFRRYNSGSAQASLNPNYIRAIPVGVPPVHEQRRIAAILGALDDKIELNRKMNGTLEEMAQAVFKSWFIDFDGHDDLVDSEIGPVPRGWDVGGIDDVAENVRDTVQPADVDGDLPYVGLEHVPRRSAALSEWGRAADVDSGKARFARGDLLFGKLRPYFHKVVPAPIAGVASTDILVVRPHLDGWRWFTFGHLFSDGLVAHATASSDGTKMPRTRWTDLCRWRIAVPPPEIATRFNAMVDPLYIRIWANVEESRTLTTLRDTLLPKLISGELRVPDAEAAISEAL